ncbi:MAG: hypothetical protein A3J62_00705 [Candidatus Buchananbacteria bacterium RIFCSPHIGHO2_02_FULL_38_8]|uniref:Carbohydrate kinase PfkB domain-containing protein n=2 Tax=Candidatus Buchananiibacteriota TaxID=1817903 RepID=A0A1G1XT46_9BACT|nr:MAG: hypothetical protein A2731_04160 [Candidatus Buchananbacteria bacterium RIFCSPHIGHO2_01_FULL_39_8]OGY47499.1 MAG: hypothetical protein A3J62_00705 [Candidatus Buchananbacteria bacterium RIFCSPHIGHO2_02_FULL_38_8]
MKFDIITIGGAVRDITFYTNKGKIFATPEDLTSQKMIAFEYGTKINIAEVYCSLGGGASNTATSLARLGFRTAIIARVGKDQDGKEIINKLKKEKINTDFIQIDPRSQTGFSFILSVDKKEMDHVAFLYRGADQNLQFSHHRHLNAKWFYLTSLSGSNWLKTIKSVFNFAAKNNIKIAWNPGNLQLQAGKSVISPWLKKTSILILNKDEAIELVLSGIKVGRRNPRYLNRPIYLLNILKEWGPKVVVVTEGKKGAWVYEGNKITHQKSRKAKAIDTTGVGDAFGSSFVAGFISNKGNIAKSLKWGMINSASVVTKIGAQNGLLTLKELKNKYK